MKLDSAELMNRLNDLHADMLDSIADFQQHIDALETQRQADSLAFAIKIDNKFQQNESLLQLGLNNLMDSVQSDKEAFIDTLLQFQLAMIDSLVALEKRLKQKVKADSIYFEDLYAAYDARLQQGESQLDFYFMMGSVFTPIQGMMKLIL
jgi:hypothetical protein